MGRGRACGARGKACKDMSVTFEKKSNILLSPTPYPWWKITLAKRSKKNANRHHRFQGTIPGFTLGFPEDTPQYQYLGSILRSAHMGGLEIKKNVYPKESLFHENNQEGNTEVSRIFPPSPVSMASLTQWQHLPSEWYRC